MMLFNSYTRSNKAWLSSRFQSTHVGRVYISYVHDASGDLWGLDGVVSVLSLAHLHGESVSKTHLHLPCNTTIIFVVIDCVT